MIMDFESVLKSTILEALIEKITNVQNKSINMPAINAFTKIIIDEPETAATAVRLITFKMQSPNEWEALQTLDLVEACLDSGSSFFLAEIGKFRFLNELIKLVSPKYLGSTTPISVRNRIIDLLKIWSQKYPTETKIKEAFEMLVKQGVTDAGSEYEMNASNSHSRVINSFRSAVYEHDDEKSKILQKLLRSTKPSDLKAANLLIKTMVKEKEEKEDFRLIMNNTKLLFEMLTNISPETSAGDIELIKELKETCVNMKPALAYMIACCNKTTRESAELLELNDFLNETLQLYRETMVDFKKPSNINPIRKTDSPIVQCSPPTLLDLNSPLEDVPHILPTQSAELTSKEYNLHTSTTVSKTESSVDALEEIFNTSFTILPNSKAEVEITNEPETKAVNTKKLFQDLNLLGKSLLKSSELTCSNQSDVTKVTLNDLVAKSNYSMCETKESGSIKDELLSEDVELINESNNEEKAMYTWKTSDIKVNLDDTNGFKKSRQKICLEPLTDVSVSLIEIKTDGNKKLTAFEDPNGICVYIQLAKNKPRADVSVFVVLANSRCDESITHFLFQPVVSKDCRLKLLPPSKSEFPPFNPHIPVDTVVQIMLIASTDKECIPLKFVISYKVKEEMMTEMGEVVNLPLR